MTTYCPHRLSSAVAAICPDIENRVLENTDILDEKRLWWELSSCILSSQVPYSLAVAAADAIDEQELLIDDYSNHQSLEKRLIKILNMPLNVEGCLRKYRFPIARSRYLATAKMIIAEEECTLVELINKFETAIEARSWLVNHVPGLGPKQASMFLRNAGVSYDLAILDRHVLNYMSTLGIYSGTARSLSTLSQYKQHEAVLREYAQQLDCTVGLLDWAIWIVMRVANRSMEAITV
jgi:N-glycosylase/DNA lyase